MERREGPADRRSLEDWRLENIERLLERLQEDLALTELDKRYMPRPELDRAFIPRAEHLKHKANATEWSVKIFLATLATGQLATAIVLLATR